MKKFSYIYEIPLFYTLFCLLNYYFAPHYPAYFGVDPHPYWIGIFLFTYRYGVVAGLISGFVSAALYLTGCWFLVERYLFDDVTFYILPSFFIIFGAGIGIGTQYYQSRISRLINEKKQAEQNLAVALADGTSLKEINRGLEKQIVSRMSTMITLYEGARRLESSNLEELTHTLLGFVAKTLDAEELAIYAKKDEAWVLEESFGWKDYQKRPQRYDYSQGMIGLAGSSGKIVTLRDFVKNPQAYANPTLLMGDCLMAGPLRKGEQGEVLAVIAIQKMPFLSFNSSAVNLFQFLLAWISRAFKRAYYIQELLENEIVDPQYQVYSFRYFNKRFDQEFARSKKYYLPLSLGLIHIDGLPSLSSEKKGLFLITLAEFLKSICRDIDVITTYDHPSIPFALLMVTTSQAQAESRAHEILNHFAKLRPELEKSLQLSLVMKIGLSSFDPKVANKEAMVETALSHMMREVLPESA